VCARDLHKKIAHGKTRVETPVGLQYALSLENRQRAPTEKRVACIEGSRISGFCKDA